MNPVELLGAGLVLLVAVGLGTVVHELSHVVALRAFGIPYEVEWLPNRERVGTARASITGDWASVRPSGLPPGRSPWMLRIAALMPLVLSIPLVLAILGVGPDPFQFDNPYLSAAVVGWLACALPSPQDFSLVWYAERALSRSD